MDRNLFGQLLNATGVLFQDFMYSQDIKRAHADREEELAKAEEKIEKKKFEIRDSNICGLLLPGIAVGIVALALLIAGIVMTVYETLWQGYSDYYIMILFGVFVSFGATILINLAIHKRRHNLKMEAELKHMIDSKEDEVIEKKYSFKIKSLNEQKRAYQQIKLNATSFLPANRRDLYSVCYFLVAIANGRCETLNECVSVMESEGQDLMSLDPDYVKEVKLENINSALYLVKNNKNLLTINSSKIDELDYFDI